MNGYRVSLYADLFRKAAVPALQDLLCPIAEDSSCFSTHLQKCMGSNERVSGGPSLLPAAAAGQKGREAFDPCSMVTYLETGRMSIQAHRATWWST